MHAHMLCPVQLTTDTFILKWPFQLKSRTKLEMHDTAQPWKVNN